jgi:hypothetical protein
MWNENPLIMYYFNSPSSAKTPAVQLKRQVTVSPTHKSIEDEVIYLRSQNKLLSNALKAVKNAASEKLCKSYELVWYARNRSKCISYDYCISLSSFTNRSCFASTARYPSHQVSKWLDSSKEHSRDIDNLHSADGDFHHGFNSGVLAASRLFKDHADVSHVDRDSVRYMARC